MMRLRVKNLGRIKDSKWIDMRPLTVFVGPNNTNKTWVAQVYGAMRSELRRDFHLPRDLLARVQGQAALVQAALSGEQDTSSIEIDVQEMLKGVRFPLVISDSSRLVGSILPVSRKQNPEALLELSREDVDTYVPRQIFFKLTVGKDRDILDIEFRSEKPGRPSRFHREYPDKNKLDSNEYIWLISEAFLPSDVPVVSFPVDRVDKLDAHPMDLEFRGYRRRKREMWGGRIRRESLWRTLYFLREEGASKPDGAEAAIARRISDYLVQGSLRTKGAGAEIEESEVEYGSGESRVRIPLSYVASLTQALAPFLFFVERSPGGSQIVIMDEPEMNAHPAAQMAIAEMIAMLVNAGWQFVITTHSPYIVSHLNNLMAGHGISGKSRKSIEKKLAMKSGDAFIDPEKAGVYLFDDKGKDVKVKSILADADNIIDWETFSKIGENIANLFGDILEAREKGGNK